MLPNIQYRSKVALGIMLSVLIIGAIFLTWNSKIFPNRKVQVMHFSYITDFTDDRKLLGASHNVLVGRVIAKKGTVRFPGDMPGEIFEIEVLENIKGKEKGIISVTKEGGCIDGKCYVLEGDIGHETLTSTESLKVGETYILAMRKDETFGHIIISHPAGKSQIVDAKEVASSKRLNALKKAYTEEIVFEGDILAKRNINTFSSLPKEEKERIQKSLQE